MRMSKDCPTCHRSVDEVRYPSDSYLNRDQWEGVRCGDYYCDHCRQYWWIKLVPSDRQSSHSLRPVTTHEAVEPAARPGAGEE